MGSTVFISYAIADTQLYHISEISKQLTSFDDIDQAFFWEEHANRNIVDYMVEKIKSCDIVLLFCSPASLNSQAVQNEYKTAQNLGRPILPVFIDLQFVPAALTTERGIQFNIYDFQSNIPQIHELINAKLKEEAEGVGKPQAEMFFTRWDDVQFLDPKNEFSNEPIFMRRGGILQVDIDEGLVARHPVIDVLKEHLSTPVNNPVDKFHVLNGKAASGKDTVIRLLASEMRGLFYYFKFDIEEASNLEILQWIESEIRKLSEQKSISHPPKF